jgi:ATP-dependent Clp protease ATP-binding subunit ClpC
MPDLVLPQKKSSLERLVRALAEVPLFWYLAASRWFLTFLKNFLLVLEDRLAITLMARLLFAPLFRDPSIVGRLVSFFYRLLRVIFGTLLLASCFLLLLALFTIWLLFPPVCLYQSLQNPLYFIFLLFVAVGVIVWRRRQPRRRIAEVKDSPVIKVEDVATRRVLQAAHLDSVKFLTTAHLFPRLENLLRRLEVEMPLKFSGEPLQVFRSQKVWQIAFEEANQTGADYLRLEHLFFGLLGFEEMRGVSEDLGLKIEDVHETIKWIQKEEEWEHPPRIWSADFEFKGRGGVNRSMLARVTPVLNQYSTDLTLHCVQGKLPRVFGKEKVLEQMLAILSRAEKNNVLLLGEPGSGKTVAIGGLAQKIIEGGKDSVLWDKRLVRLDISSLLAGARTRGDVDERLTVVIDEIKASGNIILFIDEIHGLVSEDPTTAAAFAALEPHFSDPSLPLVATDTFANYRQHIEPNAAFARIFEIVELPEANFDQALDVLEYEGWGFEKDRGVTISFPVLAAAIQMAAKFFHDRVLPDKALDLLDETVSRVIKVNGDFVGSEDVAKLVSEKINVPVTQITAEESEALLSLEERLHQRIVDQEEAIAAIAEAMRRARVGLREEGRPVASLLFVGPTGVGKTEMAKALAEVYFGSEERAIRIDMSEYQTPESAERLLSGALIEGIRRQPFSLVLLDEFEKTHEDVLNIFLQVLEDGRLTSTAGRTVDFSNAIIITTSNVGAHLIFENLEKGFAMKVILPQLEDEVQRTFAPELLNRFDGIIFCNALTLENVEDVARLMIKRVEKNLEEKEIKLEVTDEAVAELARQGYTPQQGARPLRRLIQNRIESPLAEKILSGEVKKGDTVRIDRDWLK